MKSAGVDPLTRAAIIRDYISVPMYRLESLQDRNIISFADILRLEGPAPNDSSKTSVNTRRKSTAESVQRKTRTTRQKTDA